MVAVPASAPVRGITPVAGPPPALAAAIAAAAEAATASASAIQQTSKANAPPPPTTGGTGEFRCEWSGCYEDCGSQKGLVIHMNAHLAALPWNAKESIFRCRWEGCWNVQAFQYQQRMAANSFISLPSTRRVVTIRHHIPQCPMRNCGQRFAVRSNSLAHGRTKHQRTLRPIVIDITKDQDATMYQRQFVGDDDAEGLDVDDDDDSASKASGSASGSGFGLKRMGSSESIRGGKSSLSSPITGEQRIQREIKQIEDQRRKIAKYSHWIENFRTELAATQERCKRLAGYLQSDDKLVESLSERSKAFETQLDQTQGHILSTVDMIDCK
eukprot:jgi/Hompol1/4303/HPOL_003579-RA